MRLHAQTAAIENGLVHLPRDAPWLEGYVHELLTFPNGRHDDQVDSTAQALTGSGSAPRNPRCSPIYRGLVEALDRHDA